MKGAGHHWLSQALGSGGRQKYIGDVSVVTEAVVVVTPDGFSDAMSDESRVDQLESIQAMFGGHSAKG